MTTDRILDRNQLITDSGAIGGDGSSNVLVVGEPSETTTSLRRVETETARLSNALAGDEGAVPSRPVSPTTTGSSVYTGTVLTYSSGGTGTATINGVTQNFTNSTGITLLANDVILLTKKSGVYYAIGLTTRAGVGYPGSSTTQLFTAANVVPGLPYQTLTTIGIWGSADGCVWSSTGVVVSYADAQTYTITRPSTSFDHCWGLVDDPNGPWVFVNRGVTSNGLHVVYNGVGTTHNYGACQVLGTHAGKVWVWAGLKGGVTDRRLVAVSSTGTVADYTNASLSVLSVTANATIGRAGAWGIVLWDSADVVTVSMSSGVPSTYTQYLIGTFTSLQTSVGSHITDTVISDSSFFYLSSTGTDRDYRRWNFSSATLSTFLDVLPVGFTHENIGTTGGVDAVISGHDGTDQAVCLNSGAGTTTETFTGTTIGSFDIASTPTGEVIGKIRSDSTGQDTIIGIG